MARRKHITKRARRAQCKAIALLAVMVLTAGLCIGGTVAWLISTPEPVVNTFTYGDIDITLTETDTGLDGDGETTTNTYKMMPGQTITKDPVVTVRLEKSANFDDFMEYAIDGSWANLSGVDGVYYRHITAEEIKDRDMQIHVLTEDKVTVKDSVTKDMLNGLDRNADGSPAETTDYPTLTVTAYAVQYAGNDTAE